MKAKELERKITKVGWVCVRISGSHRQYKNPECQGVVTIPFHSGDVSLNTVISLEKQTGLSLRR